MPFTTVAVCEKRTEKGKESTPLTSSFRPHAAALRPVGGAHGEWVGESDDYNTLSRLWVRK